MDSSSTRLREQTAPEKNTDHAFVQVGKDGQPVIPTGNDKEELAKEQNKETHEEQ